MDKSSGMLLTKHFLSYTVLSSIHTMRFCLQFDANAKNGFDTHSLPLMQHPIDTMLQFDAKADADANAHA